MNHRAITRKGMAFLVLAALLFQVVGGIQPQTAHAAVTEQLAMPSGAVEAVRDGTALQSTGRGLPRKEKARLEPGALPDGKGLEAAATTIPDLSAFKEISKAKGKDFTTQRQENEIDAIVVKGAVMWDGYAGPITQDIYVAPGATLITSGDALLQGDLYNYGLVIVQGVLEADFIYSNAYYNSMQGEYSNGDLIEDRNYASAVYASEFLFLEDIPSLPIAIYSDNLVNGKGHLPLIQGAILPLFELKLDSEPVTLNDNGSFTIYDYFAGNQPMLHFEILDSFGQRFTYDHALEAAWAVCG